MSWPDQLDAVWTGGRFTSESSSLPPLSSTDCFLVVAALLSLGFYFCLEWKKSWLDRLWTEQSADTSWKVFWAVVMAVGCSLSRSSCLFRKNLERDWLARRAGC